MLDREGLGRVAWDAVPLAITPVDGWNDVEAVDWAEIDAALDPGPPTWEQLQRFWPDVAASYRELAARVAATVRDESADVIAAADALAAALDEEERRTFDSDWVDNHPVWDAQDATVAAREAYAVARSMAATAATMEGKRMVTGDRRSGLYILRDGEPAPEPNARAWGQWMQARTLERIVSRTTLTPDLSVSTVFLGLDHAFDGGQPLLFESMVVGADEEEPDRYHTRAEAIAGHLAMVDRWRDVKALREREIER